MGGLLLAGCAEKSNTDNSSDIIDATVIKHYVVADGNTESVTFELDTDNNFGTWEHFVRFYNSDINKYKYMQNWAKIKIRKTNNVWLNKTEILGQNQR